MELSRCLSTIPPAIAPGAPAWIEPIIDTPSVVRVFFSAFPACTVPALAGESYVFDPPT